MLRSRRVTPLERSRPAPMEGRPDPGNDPVIAVGFLPGLEPPFDSRDRSRLLVGVVLPRPGMHGNGRADLEVVVGLIDAIRRIIAVVVQREGPSVRLALPRRD